MTIQVSPLIESRLKRRAARTGQDANALAGALLWDALADEPSEEEVRDEYHRLVALELQGQLSAAAADRLREVMRELDDLDAHSPAAEAMSRQLDETGRKLDEMLALLRGLPLAGPAG